ERVRRTAEVRVGRVVGTPGGLVVEFHPAADEQRADGIEVVSHARVGLPGGVIVGQLFRQTGQVDDSGGEGETGAGAIGESEVETRPLLQGGVNAERFPTGWG